MQLRDLIFGKKDFLRRENILFDAHGRLHCWRCNGRFDRKNVYEVARIGHVLCSMWGWIHLHSMGEVSDIGGGSDDVRNIELLEEVMIPTVRAAAKPYPERILCVQVIL